MQSAHRNFLNIIFLLIFLSFAACSSGEKIQSENPKPESAQSEYDTVKAKRFDTGKMWTFEDAPLNYFEEEYNFSPSEEWLEDARMSALKFASWCSASFVSQDGLIMTNHHCVDFIIPKIEREGEDISETGFYAETLEDERKVAGVYVDQLVRVEDITAQIKAAEEGGIAVSEKIAEIEENYSEETGLICKVQPLYEGAKYSLYCYKRYDDIRAVFIVEYNVGFFGGNPDNFSYPRYNLDAAFMRAYDENGEPLKTDHYFEWSEDGADEGELLFVIGNPGSTERLKTMAQYEYLRDVDYNNASFILNGMMNIYQTMVDKYPERKKEFEGKLIYTGNSAEVYKGLVEALNDPYLMARKKDFEDELKKQINADPELQEKFGHIWSSMNELKSEQRKYGKRLAAYNYSSSSMPVYFSLADELIKLAKQKGMPESARMEEYKNEDLDSTIADIYPAKIDEEVEKLKLALRADYIIMNLGKEDPIVQKMFGGRTGMKAAEYALDNSLVASKEKLKDLASKNSEEILNSGDPFIYFIQQTSNDWREYKSRIEEIENSEKSLENELGRAVYAIYGTSIPPDATFTLRINDGKMKGYNYNGTFAIPKTTIYGIYDRYFGSDGEFPWDLPEKWVNYPEDFDLTTTFNFVSTNDIVGGNSGSPVINKNQEIVGLAFDGNIESLPGSFLYSSEANRMVSVASSGILEIVSKIYKAERLAGELKAGKIVETAKEEVEQE